MLKVLKYLNFLIAETNNLIYLAQASNIQIKIHLAKKTDIV